MQTPPPYPSPRNLAALLRRNRRNLRRHGFPRQRRCRLMDNRFGRNAMRTNDRMRNARRRRQNKTATIAIQAALAVQVKKPATHTTVSATFAANPGPMRQMPWPCSLDLIRTYGQGGKKRNAQQLLHQTFLSHLIRHRLHCIIRRPILQGGGLCVKDYK